MDAQGLPRERRRHRPGAHPLQLLRADKRKLRQMCTRRGISVRHSGITLRADRTSREERTAKQMRARLESWLAQREALGAAGDKAVATKRGRMTAEQAEMAAYHICHGRSTNWD